MSPAMLKKLNSILDRGQKIRICGLMFMILIGGLLETAGVSLVLPLISAILDEKSFAENIYVGKIMDMFSISDVRSMIYILLIALALMFVIKNAYLVMLTYLQSRFVPDSIKNGRQARPPRREGLHILS